MPVVCSIMLAVTACSGEGEPEAEATADTQAVWPDSADPSAAVIRKKNEADFDTVLAGLTGDLRREAQALVNAAREKRLEAAGWLGKAIETEQQAREYQATGDEDSARSAREQAVDKRKRAREKLAEARADEARALALAAGEGSGSRIDR